MQLCHYAKSEICNTLTVSQSTANKIYSFLLLRYLQHLWAFESQVLASLCLYPNCPVFSLADNSRASSGDSGQSEIDILCCIYFKKQILNDLKK